MFNVKKSEAFLKKMDLALNVFRKAAEDLKKVKVDIDTFDAELAAQEKDIQDERSALKQHGTLIDEKLVKIAEFI